MRILKILTYLDSGILNSDGAGNLSSTTTINDTVVTDQVTHDAKSIVKRTLGLINDLEESQHPAHVL